MAGGACPRAVHLVEALTATRRIPGKGRQNCMGLTPRCGEALRRSIRTDAQAELAGGQGWGSRRHAE